MRKIAFDKPLALFIAILIVGGAFVFASAAFGLIAREGARGMTSVVFNHMVLGIGLGLVALAVAYALDYRIWRTYAPWLFVLALIATALVFVPQLGFEHGGGRRWISLFGTTFQPSEALKVATLMIGAAYFASIRHRAATLLHGLGGFLAILAGPALLLIAQPDLGTLGVISISLFALYVAAGARLRDIAIIVIIGVVSLGVLATFRPYVRDRINTFFNPAQGQQAEGYQIRQSLIAVGSGGLTGRGFGQSVQKFTYLPEPMGDSIFAVAAEELGFIGAIGIIGLFLGFALRGLTLSAHAPDAFAALLGVGISTYLASEAFINIAAMLAMAPLTGIPLTFVSQGGSAMLMSLFSAGILLNVTRHRRR